MSRIVRRRVVGANDVRLIEAMNQQAALVIDVQAERTANDPHPLGAEEFLGFGEQRREDGVIVDRIDEAEETAIVLVSRQMCAVDRGDDPPDGEAVAEGDEWLNSVHAHEGRPARTEDRPDFVVNLLDPMGIDRLRALSRCNERGDSSAVDDRNDLNLAHEAAAPRASVFSEIALVASSSRATTGTTLAICSLVCSLLKKKRSRAKRSGIAGWMMG